MKNAVTTVDLTGGTAMLASPLWIQVVESGIEAYVLVAGGALVTIRLVLACRELLQKRKKTND